MIVLEVLGFGQSAQPRMARIIETGGSSAEKRLARIVAGSSSATVTATSRPFASAAPTFETGPEYDDTHSRRLFFEHAEEDAARAIAPRESARPSRTCARSSSDRTWAPGGGLDERWKCGRRPSRRRVARLVSTRPRPLRAKSGAPTTSFNRRSAALTAG